MAELKISYEKGWENSCVHIDIPIIYREDYGYINMKKGGKIAAFILIYP